MKVRMFNNNYNNYNNYSNYSNYNKYNNRLKDIAFKQIIRNDIAAKIFKNNKFKIVVFHGPSGVGKGTVIKEISNKHKLRPVVSHTTRPMRKGEVDGVNYFFISTEEFDKGINNHEFIEYEKLFSGKYYGTKLETVSQALKDGKPVLLELDVNGGKRVKNYFKDDPNVDVISVFLRPPSIETLKERLLKRGTETMEAITERIGRAEYEISQAKYCDAEIQVNNVEESVNDIEQLLHLGNTVTNRLRGFLFRLKRLFID